MVRVREGSNIREFDISGRESTPQTQIRSFHVVLQQFMQDDHLVKHSSEATC